MGDHLMLTKDQILNADDIQTKVIDVPEWGGEVTIKSMSGFYRDRFENSLVGKNGGANMQNVRAKLVAASIVDDKGDVMFSEKDITKLGSKSGDALDRVFAVAKSINKITDDEVKELAKNS